MASFVLFIAIVVGAASFVSFTAQDIAAAGYGQHWASDVCMAAPVACDNPQQMAYIATAFGGLWIVMKFVAALRD